MSFDIQHPFETFQTSAFRLEALPKYLVENEREAFAHFKETGEIPAYANTEWSSLVEHAIAAGKTMQRLRLLSDELTPYEQFELHVYSGLEAGEDIRLNARQAYKDVYRYDFWFFDDTYISQIHYEADGTFVRFETREATDEEREMAHYWVGIFEQSTKLGI